MTLTNALVLGNYAASSSIDDIFGVPTETTSLIFH